MRLQAALRTRAVTPATLRQSSRSRHGYISLRETLRSVASRSPRVAHRRSDARARLADARSSGTGLKYAGTLFVVMSVASALFATSAALASPTGQRASTLRTWMNVSGCAAPGGGPYNQPVWAQHPAAIGGTCDGSASYFGVRWRHWGDAAATATATLKVALGCTPSCAAAPRRDYAVTFVAANVKYCGTRRIYGTITMRYRQPPTRLTRGEFHLYDGCGPLPSGYSARASLVLGELERANIHQRTRRLPRRFV